MRKMVALMLCALVLAGCTAVPGQETTAPRQTAPPSETGWEPVGEQGNLWYVPSEAVESAPANQLMEDGGDLLLGGGGEEYTLLRLSGETLEVTARATLTGSDLAYAQVLDEGICLADPAHQTVTMLTDSLQIADSISSSSEENTWLMSTDGGKLITMTVEGITAHELQTGQTVRLLDARILTVLPGGRRLQLAAVADGELMTRWYELDLKSCVLTELQDARMTALQEGMRPQSTGDYIKVYGRTLTMYEQDGGFVSTCTLPEELGQPGRDFVWCSRREGWFFLTYGDSGNRLLFWDPAVHTQGEDADIEPEPVPEGTILEQELYDRAEALSKRFDLDIRIADRALRDYGSYDSEILTDPEIIANALDVLEEVLAQYPDGFFTQLKYGNRHSVRIELVDALAGKSGHDVSSGTSAFTVRRDQYCLIVFNGSRIRPSVIFHEFSHVIDDRMAWEAKLRPEALYSEESWLSLQPEGFAYADSYQDISDDVAAFYDSGYFATDYACVSATEDRAVTMEKAAMGEQAVFDANPHLMPKLRYYCDCIRDSFDTTGWPEVTFWEKLLDTAD